MRTFVVWVDTSNRNSNTRVVSLIKDFIKQLELLTIECVVKTAPASPGKVVLYLLGCLDVHQTLMLFKG